MNGNAKIDGRGRTKPKRLRSTDLGYYADLNNFDNLTKIVEGLPFELQRRWLRYATAIEEDGLEASFSDLAHIVKDEALVVNPSYGRIFREGHHRRETKVSLHSTAVEVVNYYDENASKCSYCRGSQMLRSCASFKPVFLKLGEIAPLGAILMDKRAKKSKGAIGGEKKHQGGENAQPQIDH